MITYCVSWKKNTIFKTSTVRTTKQNILMLLWSCASCGKLINQGLLKIKKQVDFCEN